MADENDPNAEALARGDILPEDPDPTPGEEEQEELPLAAAADPDASETPSEEDDGEGGEATSAAADDKDDKDHRVPKSRFDEAVKRERERAAQYERELEKYRAREQQQKDAEDLEASEAKVKEMLKQHSSLLADGDLDKASEVMGEILQLRDDMQTVRMTRQADNARNSAKIEVQYDATVARLEAEYPVINPDADDFDPAAVRRVQAMVTGIMQNDGKNPAEALQEATDILLKPLKEAKGETLRDKPSPEAVEQGMRRTQQAIDKNVKTAAKQPPATGDVGKDHDASGGALDAAAVSRMSWEDFVKLPDEELAKMRGDYIN